MPTGIYERKNRLTAEQKKAKAAERMRNAYASKKEIRDRQKSLKLQKAYGITLEQYNDFNEAFEGVCHICGNECPSKRRLAVDHEHKDDGLIRGLLCINCNKGLGNFKDSAALMKKAIKYLKTFDKIKTEVESAIKKIVE
jgi:hypothetical protein